MKIVLLAKYPHVSTHPLDKTSLFFPCFSWVPKNKCSSSVKIEMEKLGYLAKIYTLENYLNKIHKFVVLFGLCPVCPLC